MRCLIRGIGDVGSAVAHALHGAGHEVVIHDSPRPTTHRRGMAFVDAVYDGRATLEGTEAVRIDAARDVATVSGIAVYTGLFSDLLVEGTWDVLVDARMRKRSRAEDQRAQAGLMVGLGPGFTVNENCHRAVETSWDRLGTIVDAGSTEPLRGEPRAILGHARDRLIYAPRAGLFSSTRRIGESVTQGEAVGSVDGETLSAPLAGVLRGLTRSDIPVEAGTKLAEIDPRGDPAQAFGLGERPRRIADAVLKVLSRLPVRTSEGSP